MEELLNYYTTGGLKFLETGLICLLLVFLGWNVKLYIEKHKSMDKPLEDDIELPADAEDGMSLMQENGEEA